MKNIFHEIKLLFSKSPNLTSLGVASAISNGIGGLFWFYIASLLGTELYGEVSYLISIAVVGSTLALFGSANTIIVLSAKKIKIQTTIYFVVVISAICSSIILFVLFENFSISIFVIGYVFFVLFTSDLLGKKYFVKYSKIIVSQKILQVALAILLYNFFELNGVILGMGISFIPFGIMLFSEFRNIPINFSLLRNHVGFMSNNYFLDISKSLEGSIDKIILAPILGFALLGNFQLGIQFLTILTILPVVVFQYTLPNDATGNSVRLVKKFVIILSIIFAILAIVITPILLPMIFPDYSESIFVIQIMSIAIIPFTITTTFTSKLLGNEKSKYVLIGSSIFVGSQVITIIILSTYFGIVGAAISVLISRIIETIYYFIINKTIVKLESNS